MRKFTGKERRRFLGDGFFPWKRDVAIVWSESGGAWRCTRTSVYGGRRLKV